MAHGVFADGGSVVIVVQVDGAWACLARLAGGKARASGRRPLDPASHGSKRVVAPMRGGALRAEPRR